MVYFILRRRFFVSFLLSARPRERELANLDGSRRAVENAEFSVREKRTHVHRGGGGTTPVTTA